MSWQNQQSSWGKSQHRNVTSSVWRLVYLIPFLVVYGALLKQYNSIYYVFILIFILLWGIWMLRQIWIEYKIGHLIPSCDGWACPWCKVKIIENDSKVQCTKCHRNFNIGALKHYWISYALAPENAIKSAVFICQPKGIFRNKPQILYLKLLLRRQKRSLVFLLFALISVCFMTYVDKQLAENIVAVFRITGYFLGIFILIGCRLPRQGKEKYCAACKNPCPLDGKIPECCSECDAKWKTSGEYITGQRKNSKIEYWVGICVLLIWLVVMLLTVDIMGMLEGMPGLFMRIYYMLMA